MCSRASLAPNGLPHQGHGCKVLGLPALDRFFFFIVPILWHEQVARVNMSLSGGRLRSQLTYS